ALVLGHEPDPLADVEPAGADVEAEDLAGARVDADEAEQGADEGGLARAVGAEQADGAGAGLDRQVAQGGDRAIRLGDVTQPKEHRLSRKWRRGVSTGSSPAAGGDWLGGRVFR